MVAVELAGHGADNTPVADICLETYVDQVNEALQQSPEPAVLVGHSLGGIVITQVAEVDPSRVRALAYVCAYLPRTGESLLDWAGRDSESLVTPNVMRSRDGLTLTVRRRVIREAICADCSIEEANWAMAQLVPEPSVCFETPVTISDARFGQVARTYVHCLKDRTVPFSLQKRMVQQTPCTTVELDSGHCPFLSVPVQLAQVLKDCASAPSCT